MYKINIYSALLIVSLSFSSCHDDLLNPIPESVLTTANAFNSAKDINLAVLGVYNRLQARQKLAYWTSVRKTLN